MKISITTHFSSEQQIYCLVQKWFASNNIVLQTETCYLLIFRNPLAGKLDFQKNLTLLIMDIELVLRVLHTHLFLHLAADTDVLYTFFSPTPRLFASCW